MLKNFLRPLTTGDVWWQDGQIKEEEEEDLYIPRICLPIWLQENRQSNI
jgi:hypothetical protein